MNGKQYKIIKEDLKRSLKEKIVHRIVKGINESIPYDNTSNDSHFAIYIPQNKIIYSWDYSDVDSNDLKNAVKDYFTVDIEDNGINPKDVKVVNRNTCMKLGLDPSDQNNWTNGSNDKRWSNPESNN